jgi:hypothetical protein
MGGITRDIGTMMPEEIDRRIQEVVSKAGTNGFILCRWRGSTRDVAEILHALYGRNKEIQKVPAPLALVACLGSTMNAFSMKSSGPKRDTPSFILLRQ